MVARSPESCPDTEGRLHRPGVHRPRQPCTGDPCARGAIVGLTRGERPRAPGARGRRGDGVSDRATSSKRWKPRPDARAQLRRDSGAAVMGPRCCSCRADQLQVPVARPTVAGRPRRLGPPLTRGLAAGVWSSARRARRHWHLDRAVHRRARPLRLPPTALRGWKRAVDCFRTWPRSVERSRAAVRRCGDASERASSLSLAARTRRPCLRLEHELVARVGRAAPSDVVRPGAARQHGGGHLVALDEARRATPPPEATGCGSTCCRRPRHRTDRAAEVRDRVGAEHLEQSDDVRAPRRALRGSLDGASSRAVASGR